MNKVILGGTVVGIPIPERRCYRFDIATKRLSETVDTLHCIAPERFAGKIFEGAKIRLKGELQSKIHRSEKGSRLFLYVFVKEISEYAEDENAVGIIGETITQTVFRETPRGRIITDVLIKVPRNSNRDIYAKVPLLAWNDDAARISNAPVGTKMFVEGRLQSRSYIKFYDDETSEKRTVNELSAKYIKTEE